MKTLLFVALLTAFFSQNVNGQTYDFATGKFTDLGPKKAGEMVAFRVININTFRYKVTIKGDQIVYLTPVPTELQTLFRLPEPTKSVSDADEGKAKAEGAKDDMQNLASTLPAGSLKNEMNTLVALCTDFVIKANAVREIKFRRAQLISLAKQNWVNHAALVGNLPATLTVTAMQTTIQNFINAYQNAETQYAIALDKAAPDSTKEKRIKNALERFEEGYEDIDEDDFVKRVEDIDVLQNALADSRNFTVVSPAVQAEGDFLGFNILIEPDRTNDLLPHESSLVSKAEIAIRKSWKADFSVGPNFSFYDGSRDEKYFLNPTLDGKGTLTKGDNANVVRPGIAAMLHAYPRTGKDFAAGFMMGVGAGFTNENALTASYYLGGSLVLGKSQKIMINAGLSFLSVDRLKAGYTAGNEYIIESTKIADVTEKALLPSFFFGISYNITNRVVVK